MDAAYLVGKEDSVVSCLLSWFNFKLCSRPALEYLVIIHRDYQHPVRGQLYINLLAPSKSICIHMISGIQGIQIGGVN